MKIIVKLLDTLIGGLSKLNKFMAVVFRIPLGPRSDTNPMATTIVGITKGTVDSAFRIVLPGNSNLVNKYAIGNPTIRLKNVETAACQIVNQIRVR